MISRKEFNLILSVILVFMCILIINFAFDKSKDIDLYQTTQKMVNFTNNQNAKVPACKIDSDCPFTNQICENNKCLNSTETQIKT